MNELQFYALLPFTVLAAASLIVILLIAFKQSHTVIQVVGFLMMCAVIFTMWFVRDTLPVDVPPLFVVDGFAALFTGLIVFSVLVVGLFSFIYFEEREENPKEYYILLFLSTLGAAVLTISKHFISLFLGLEILSVSLYALIAYLRNRNNAIEAGIKYLVIAAVSSAFLLFGMALIYLQTGSMDFTVMGSQLKNVSAPLFITGVSLMVVAIGFKLALVPFHFWAADVYQGAPSPVTAFVATVSKIGLFSVLVRFAESLQLQSFNFPFIIFSIIAIASMVSGNLLALQQQNLKRLLAYSSIAHFGYLIVAFLPGNESGIQASIFYLTAYSVTVLAAFGIITALSTSQKDAEDLQMYKGLFWVKPVPAIVLSVAMLSLAGIPFTGGFIGKFAVLSSGVQQHLWWPVIVLVLSSVVGLYYYLRVIVMLFTEPATATSKSKSLHPFFYTVTYSVLILLTLLLFGLGIFPSLLFNEINKFLSISF